MNKKRGHKLIFEGVELAGKSSIVHPIYDFLEQKYNTQKHILNGCHWFNSDVGIFGTEHGPEIIEKYIEMAEIMPDKNVIFEKLHISDQVYSEVYGLSAPGSARQPDGRTHKYNEIEKRLSNMGARIILCIVNNQEKIFEERLKDRLTLYTHYGRISRQPAEYLLLQNKYLETVSRSKLPILKVNLTKLPNPEVVKEILNWLGENDNL